MLPAGLRKYARDDLRSVHEIGQVHVLGEEHALGVSPSDNAAAEFEVLQVHPPLFVHESCTR